jgi:hypothetical protein
MKKIICILLIAISLLISSCSNSKQDSEISILQTQNALLAEQINIQKNSNNNAEISALQTQNSLLSAQQSNETINQEQNSSEEFIIPTATLESLPTYPIEAGTPIIYDGWAITLLPEFEFDDENIRIFISIRNLGERQRSFRYIKWDLNLQDDLNNIYEKDIGSSDCYDLMKTSSQTIINEGDSKTFSSWRLGHWACDYNNLQQFTGPIPVNAKQLIVTIDNWGPFSGIQFFIDL